MTQKPQAASHMLWFFILPCIGFVLWASFKLGKSLGDAPPTSDIFQKINSIETASNMGDRWQSAYALSQELQLELRQGLFIKWDEQKKDRFFREIQTLLDHHASDSRLKKYFLLTLGKMGDARALPALQKGLLDRDSEIRFFSMWGILDILQKHTGLRSKETEATIASHLDDSDPSLVKIIGVFLAQSTHSESVEKAKTLLKHPDSEVQLNVAIALSEHHHKEAVPVLIHFLNIPALRAFHFHSPQDLTDTLRTTIKAGSVFRQPEIQQAIEALRVAANNNTSEGHAIQEGLK